MYALTASAADKPTIFAAWARATAPHQDSAAIYLTITADTDTTLVSVASPDAGMAMLHTTTRTGDMSAMSDMPTLALKAHHGVTLSPGGMHIMLTGLRHPLTAGSTVNLSLHFSDGEMVAVRAPVQPIGALGPPPASP